MPGAVRPRLLGQIRDGPEHTKAAMCRTPIHKYVMRLCEKDDWNDGASGPIEELNHRINDGALAPVLAQL